MAVCSQAFLGTGVSHSIDVFPEEDLKWFGFTVGPMNTFLENSNEVNGSDQGDLCRPQ